MGAILARAIARQAARGAPRGRRRPRHRVGAPPGRRARGRCASSARAAELLERADVTGVVVAVSSAHHLDVIRQAASAGREIFCEKPLALTVADTEAAIAATARRRRAPPGRLHAPLRPAYRRAWRRLASRRDRTADHVHEPPVRPRPAAARPRRPGRQRRDPRRHGHPRIRPRPLAHGRRGRRGPRLGIVRRLSRACDRRRRRQCRRQSPLRRRCDRRGRACPKLDERGRPDGDRRRAGHDRHRQSTGHPAPTARTDRRRRLYGQRRRLGGAGWGAGALRFDRAYVSEIRAFARSIARRHTGRRRWRRGLAALRIAVAAERSMREGRPIAVDEP